jgi:hypothetical protein
LSITSGSTHFPHPPGPPPPPPSGVSTFVTSIPRGLRWEIGPRKHVLSWRNRTVLKKSKKKNGPACRRAAASICDTWRYVYMCAQLKTHDNKRRPQPLASVAKLKRKKMRPGLSPSRGVRVRHLGGCLHMSSVQSDTWGDVDICPQD